MGELTVPVDEQQALEPEADEMPRCMDTATFMKTYTLQVEKEWELDGKVSEWGPSTSGRPLEWGEEYRNMDLPKHDGRDEEEYLASDSMAVSPDGKLLALATGKVIRVYEMANKDLRAELVGHLGSVSSLKFAPQISFIQPQAQYTLLSQGSVDPVRYSQDHTIITWYLDDQGKALNTSKPLPVEDLADKALNGVSPDLTLRHGLSNEAIDGLRKAFLEALKTEDTKNRQRDLTSFPGTFPSFGSKPISHDGSRVLHVFHNDSTQRGTRSAESLPQILVRSLHNLNSKPVATLQGYKDAIMWASFSPTKPNIIASACWDGTYRIWDIYTSPEPTCLHTIKIKGKPQNWSGAFSPDGEHVLLSGTDNVAIYSVTTGEELFSLSSQRKLAAWVRAISWNPKDNTIALVSGSEVLLWEPFHPEEPNKCSAVVTLVKNPKQRVLDLFMEFRTLTWLNEDVLATKAGEDSWLVWDRKKNLKWRFQRPKGIDGELYATDCALVENQEGKRVFVSLDGDRKVREWLLE